MDHLEILRRSLHDDLKRTEKALIEAKTARDNAPTAMESHSDESRSRLEGVVTMLELKMKETRDFISAVPSKRKRSDVVGIWSYLEVQLSGSTLNLFIVPESMGGKEFEGIRFISSSTPIGLALLNKKRGDDFSFNGSIGKIISLE